MTNYQANGQWWGGYTDITWTRAQNGHFLGEGDRLLSNHLLQIPSTSGGFGTTNPFSYLEPQTMTYNLDPQQGTLLLNGQYGPFPFTCLANKFLIINSSDSIEVISFAASPRPN